MNKLVGKIGLMCLCVMYLIATLGFSVHTCMCESSSELILPWVCDFSSDTDCHGHDCQGDCAAHCHDNGDSNDDEFRCCRTEYFVVEDLFFTNSENKTQPVVKDLVAINLSSFLCDTFSLSSCSIADFRVNIFRNFLIKECDIFERISQYRI